MHVYYMFRNSTQLHESVPEEADVDFELFLSKFRLFCQKYQ